MNKKNKIRKPIFVNGFTRGGTNIVMNILLSHPEVCMPSGELQKIFWGKGLGDNIVSNIKKRLLYASPFSIIKGIKYFNPNYTNGRTKLPELLRRYFDQIIFWEKNNAVRHEGHNRFIRPNKNYTEEQIKKARLVCKNINGLVALTDELNDIYKDARFVCVVRNGLALLESHLRRGISFNYFSNLYAATSEMMLSNNERLHNYLIVKYEDIVENPQKMMRKIYDFVGLNLSNDMPVRFQRKSTVGKDGKSHSLGNIDRTLIWYKYNTMHEHFKSGVNVNQIKKLKKQQINKFLGQNKLYMEKFGYLENNLGIEN